MPFKRDFDDAEDTYDGYVEPEPKRARTKTSRTRQHQNSGIDPTWGQKYVFSDFDGATTIPHGEEDEFEDDADAMAYLASVRQQATSIPHLLVAPRVQIGPQLPSGFGSDQESDEEGEVDDFPDAPSETDSRGYYEDGAYIGVSTGNWDDEELRQGDADSGNPDMALREAYYAAVLRRFARLRATLRSTPPADATSRLKGEHLTDAPPFGRYSSTTKIWSDVVRNTDPHPLQVALLSKDSAIRILRVILGGKLLQQGYQIPERTSCWLWALLARLPDQGELNHTEMGWVRDLGRRAILLGRSLAEMAALRDELAQDGYGGDDVSIRDDEDGAVAEMLNEDEDGIADTEDGQDEAQAEAAGSDPSLHGGRVQSVVRDNEERPDESGKEEAEDEKGEYDEQEGEGDGEEGEVYEDGNDSGGDAAMDLASDSEADEGQVAEGVDEQEALEAAKRALLAKLAEAEEERNREAARQRARMNMRATLCMIITVAGELYGQRDLLEFREPFVGM